MRRADDPMVKCHFDRSHVMPRPRYQWHLVKCKAHKKYQDSGRPIYHCKWNYMHIFFTEAKLLNHQKNCHDKDEEFEKNQAKLKLIENRKTQEQKDSEYKQAIAKWNQSGSDSSSEDEGEGREEGKKEVEKNGGLEKEEEKKEGKKGKKKRKKQEQEEEKKDDKWVGSWESPVEIFKGEESDPKEVKEDKKDETATSGIMGMLQKLNLDDSSDSDV
ncbi:unnamed protein product [Moneuplotes crassus]|uniref:CHHC U11-48K-type domain-containing protein n=1 Tax=Euplotes crassus TaxID=5936 RepID=A0AAD1UJJ8_EUPCR|nr:unnamed protein product [Moneuplotes crassus]